MLRVCSAKTVASSASAPWVMETGTSVDSTGKRVVCLKGFEDDGLRHSCRCPSGAEAAAQCGFARIFDKRLNVPVVRSRSS